MEKIVTSQGDSTLHNPPLVYTLFSTTAFAWLWAIVRVYLGYEWIKASIPKLSDPAWVGTGEALKGVWTKALGTSEQGRPTIRLRLVPRFPELYAGERLVHLVRQAGRLRRTAGRHRPDPGG